MDTNNSKQVVNITLLGGSRCGKTTTLSLIERNFNEIYNKSNLKIEKPENVPVLDEKWDEISNYYSNRDHLKRSFIPNKLPTKEKSVYEFKVSLKGREMKPISMNFTDFPGEWLDDNNHKAEIISSIKASDAILVAIDSPYLMEYCETNDLMEIGPYNEDRNFSERISELLIEGFSTKGERKMLVFIPTKCEKYIQKGRREELYQKIKNAYSKVISNFKSYNYTHGEVYEILVAPIETFGSVHFSRFETYNGEIRLNEYAMPAKAIYSFNDDAKNYPEPKNCEIPLEIILLYLLNETETLDEKVDLKVSFFAKLMGLNKTPDDSGSIEKELKEQEIIIRNRLKEKIQAGDILVISDPYRISL